LDAQEVATYCEAKAAALPFAEASFDFVAAFMSLMDSPRQEDAIGEVHRLLHTGGFLQVSILHPCFAPLHRKTLCDAAGDPCAVEPADYFRRTEGDVETWSFGAAPAEERGRPFAVPRFHCTLADWVATILGSGLVIEAPGEPMADDATSARMPDVAVTPIVPLFLRLRARKPG